MTQATLSRAGYPGRTGSFTWGTASRLTDLLLAAMLVVIGLPETVFEKMYVGEVPLAFALFYAAAASMLIEVVVSANRQRLSRRLAAAILLGLFMAAVGFRREAETKWWVVDASVYCGFLLGLAWSERRSAAAAVRTVHLWGSIAAVLLAVNLIGLVSGFVPPVVESDRRYCSALFYTAGFVVVAFPFWFASARGGCPGLDGLCKALPACLGITGVLFAAYISATRSLLIAGIASILLAYWAVVRDPLFSALVLVLAVVVVLAAGQTGALETLQRSLLFDRLVGTTMADEARYVELEMMFHDLASADERWLGRGFGSRFDSNVQAHLDGLAVAPHVGVLAPWFKGGVPAFALMILLPGLAALSGLLLKRRSKIRQAGRAGLLAYLALASMSGGWDFALLFLYGIFSAAAFDKRLDFSRCESSAS